ncbi:MAG: GNAT family N-acetyltransferase [Verrucomicrobiales bacterium]
MALLRQSIEDEALAHRTQQDLLARLGDYFLLEVDKNIIGTVAVHQHAADGGGISAELACLYVRRSHENQGHGRRLVRFAELKARGLGAKQLFAITTQADQFFSDKCGFRETGAEELPPARREALERSGRRSKVFLKDL